MTVETIVSVASGVSVLGGCYFMFKKNWQDTASKQQEMFDKTALSNKEISDKLIVVTTTLDRIVSDLLRHDERMALHGKEIDDVRERITCVETNHEALKEKVDYTLAKIDKG